jgi:hypothetical protein
MRLRVPFGPKQVDLRGICTFSPLELSEPPQVPAELHNTNQYHRKNDEQINEKEL